MAVQLTGRKRVTYEACLRWAYCAMPAQTASIEGVARPLWLVAAFLGRHGDAQTQTRALAWTSIFGPMLDAGCVIG